MLWPTTTTVNRLGVRRLCTSGLEEVAGFTPNTTSKICMFMFFLLSFILYYLCASNPVKVLQHGFRKTACIHIWKLTHMPTQTPHTYTYKTPHTHSFSHTNSTRTHTFCVTTHTRVQSESGVESEELETPPD